MSRPHGGASSTALVKVGRRERRDVLGAAPSTGDAHFAIIPRAPRADHTRVRLVTIGTWAWNGLGGSQVVFPRTPATASEFGQVSAMWDRFRVVGMRLRIFFQKYYPVVSCPPGIIAVYDNDAVPSGFTLTPSAATQYADAVYSEVYGLFDLRLPTLPKGQGSSGGATATTMEWTDFGTPTALYGCVAITTVSGNLMPEIEDNPYYVLEWDVECAGRR